MQSNTKRLMSLLVALVLVATINYAIDNSALLSANLANFIFMLAGLILSTFAYKRNSITGTAGGLVLAIINAMLLMLRLSNLHIPPIL